jgi:cyanate permease
MTHRWVIPLFHGTPQAVETSHAMWDVPRGWAVPVWLGCPSLAGVSQFGWGVPAVVHPTLKRAVPRQLVRPSAAWDVPRGWAVPSLAGLSQFGWAVPLSTGLSPAAGHPALGRAVPFHSSVA